MLEEFGLHLDEAKKKYVRQPPPNTSTIIEGCVCVCVYRYRCEESKVRADQTSKLLAQVKNGVQHLSEKLQHIKMVRTGVSLYLYI